MKTQIKSAEERRSLEDTNMKPQDIDGSIWKQLGITQAFDLLLVKACLDAKGTLEEMKSRAGHQLSGGALKFWDRSFPELVRDLTRQEILSTEGGLLGLHPSFGERLQRAQQRFDQQSSRVVRDESVALNRSKLELRQGRNEQQSPLRSERVPPKVLASFDQQSALQPSI